MTLEDIARQRLANQKLMGTNYANPADVVRWLGAVQAQEYYAVLYAIGLRMRAATEETIEQALADKEIVRNWPMRGTIHLVPPDDVRWMTRLLGPRLDAKVVGNYRRAGLSPAEVAKAGEVFASELRGGVQLTRAELYEALQAAGISTAAQNGEQRGMHLIVHWARHGLICFAPKKGNQPTFTLLDDWITDGRDLSGDDAIVELGRRYFASHGPATLKDFAWWTGLTITEIKRVADRFTKELAHEVVDGLEYWFSPAQTKPASDVLQLLPAFDEYTVAYTNRSAAFEPSQAAEVRQGLGPNVVLNGRIVGTWKRTLQRTDIVVVDVALLQPLNAAQLLLLSDAIERYGAFLNRTVKASHW